MTKTATKPLVTYLLRQGDRSLISAQRLLEWVTRAPEIEEDMALSNLALDLIGNARALYTYAGTTEGNGRDEDTFAYFRDQHEFYNPLLVEQPAPNFAYVIARQFFHDTFTLPYWQAMVSSSDATLAALAAKTVKETTYHLRHTRTWCVRLGDGTETSHGLMQAAITDLARFTGELFETDAVEDELGAASIAANPADVRAGFDRIVTDTLSEATLTWPDDVVMQTGGRHGQHSERFSYLLGEMQVIARAHPGATW